MSSRDDDIVEEAQSGSWQSYQRLVLYELRRLNEQAKSTERKVDTLSTDVTRLKTISGFIGAAAGILASWVMSFFKMPKP